MQGGDVVTVAVLCAAQSVLAGGGVSPLGCGAQRPGGAHGVEATVSGWRGGGRQPHGSYAQQLPKTLKKRRPRLAIDLTLIPYHGQAQEREEEVYRGEAKAERHIFMPNASGTSSMRVSAIQWRCAE